MMSPAFNIILLLLFGTVGKSVEDQPEEKLKEKRADLHAEEILQDGVLQDLCGGCKSLVTKIKEKIGEKASKAKIAKMVEDFCSKEKEEQLAAACKKITGEVKDELSAAIAEGDDPKTVCKKVKLCKKKKPPPPHHL